MSSRSLFAALTGVLLSALMTSAVAQGTGAQLALEEITVTAQRREQNLSDVPLAIDAIGGDDVLFRGIEDVQRLSEEIPSLVVGGQGQTFGALSLSIRGVGSQLGDTAVGFYIDEMYQANSSGFVSQFLDVERVEVLKGPQGTLWGRNNTGGTINYVTKKPVLGDPQFDVFAEIGTYDSLDASDLPIFKLGAAGNIPLGDRAAARISASKVSQDNYTFNLERDNPEPNQDATTVRASVLAEPTDTLSLLFGLSFIDDPAHNSFLFKNRPFAGSAVGFIVDLLDDVATEPDPYRVRSNLDPVADFEELGGRLEVTWHVNDQWNIRSLTGYKDLSLEREADLDSTQVTLVHNSSFQDHEWLTQELQLQYDDERFSFIGGLFYFEEDFLQTARTSAQTSLFFLAQCNGNNPPNLVPVAALCPFVNSAILPTAQLLGGGTLASTDFVPGGLWDNAVSFVESGAMLPPGTLAAFNSVPAGLAVSGTDRHHETQSTAAYAQASYNFTDAVTLTGGLRYTEDDKNINISNYSFGAVTGTPSLDRTFSELTPKLGIEWRPNDDTLGYASITRGFKSGTVNQFAETLAGEDPSVEPETITAYEVGLKRSLFDNTLYFDGAAFFYDYENYQVSVQFPAGPQVFNLSAVDISGLEAAITAKPTDAVELGMSASYVKSEVAADVLAVDPFDLAAGSQNLRGEALPRTPEWKGTAFASYTWNVTGGALTANANFNYSGEYANDPFGTFPGADYSTLNGGLRYVADSGVWWINLYGRNLTSEEYVTASLFSDSIGEVQFFAPPRTIGLQFGLRL